MKKIIKDGLIEAPRLTIQTVPEYVRYKVWDRVVRRVSANIWDNLWIHIKSQLINTIENKNT